MRIEIINNSSSSRSLSFLGSNLSTLISQSETTIASLHSLKRFSHSMNGGIGLLQGAVNSIDGRIGQEETRKSNLINTQTKLNSFVELVGTTDKAVSERVCQNQEMFYDVNAWSRPTGMQLKVDAWLSSAKKWLKETKNKVKSFLDHYTEIYDEIDFTKLSDSELRGYYSNLNELRESGNMTSDDEIRLQALLDYLSGVEVKPGMPEHDKMRIELYNQLYEKIHIDDAEAINTFFQGSAYKENGELEYGITEDDIAYIKYIAYKSTSPCHDVFFDNIANCHVESWFHTKDNGYGDLVSAGSYYKIAPGVNEETGAYEKSGVYLNFKLGEDGLNNPRGAYNTFFHEIGHNIDDLLVGGYDYDASRSYVGVYTTDVLSSGSFYDVIYGDVENNFKKSISHYSDYEAYVSIDSSGQAKILDVLMGRADRNSLNPRLDFAYRKIYEDYTGKWKGVFSGVNWEGNEGGSLEGVQHDQVSDITGGITNNTTKGDYGHMSDGYWYSGKNSGDIIGGNVPNSGLQEMEFFAEYFAYEMTGDRDETYARKYLPNSYKVMDEAMSRLALDIKRKN